MIKEKQGKLLKLSRVNKRLLLNHPLSLLSYSLAKKVSTHSMLSYTALYQLERHLRVLSDEGLQGSIVEMGCWKGGCGAFMTKVAEKYSLSRSVWLFDSFEGLPELTKEDAEWAKNLDVTPANRFSNENIQSIGLYKATEKDVQDALKSAGCEHIDRVHIIKGWFQNSVPSVQKEMGPIALLRLDGDTYESTKYCLETLYAQVVKGGFVVIDDFHLLGCRQAIFEFFINQGEYPEIRTFPYGGRMFWRKKKTT